MSLTAICMQVNPFIELPVYQITKVAIVMPVKNRLSCVMANKFFLEMCSLGAHGKLLCDCTDMSLLNHVFLL